MSSACGAPDAQHISDDGAHSGVATWAQLEREAPGVADVAARLWPGPLALHRNESLPEGAPWFAVGYLGTVRRVRARRSPDPPPQRHRYRKAGSVPPRASATASQQYRATTER